MNKFPYFLFQGSAIRANPKTFVFLDFFHNIIVTMMKKTFKNGILLCGFLFASCGTLPYQAENAKSSSPIYAQQAYQQRSFDENEQVQQREEAAPLSKRSAGQIDKTKTKPIGKKGEPEEPRQVIYSARIEMEIRNLRETQEKVLEIMKNNGGFLESQSGERMAIRVPSENFDQAVNQILKLGLITDKKIFTQDVSDQYNDLERRLMIAEKSKARLLEMLPKVKEVKEKVKIIEEIKRLTQEIESYKSLLATMESFVRYSLIELILRIPAEDEIKNDVTPFPWINRLNPQHQTLTAVTEKEIRFQLPPYFLLFRQEATYLARNPEGAFVRAGKTQNHPLGDGEFWQKALNRGMEFKNYEVLIQGKSEKTYYSLYRFKSPTPFSLLTALQIQGDEIFILEIFFPNEEIREKQQDLFLKALNSFEVAP